LEATNIADEIIKEQEWQEAWAASDPTELERVADQLEAASSLVLTLTLTPPHIPDTVSIEGRRGRPKTGKKCQTRGEAAPDV